MHGSDANSILIIDDTPANLHLLTQILSEHGYKIRAVRDGKHGLAAAQAAPPDLILLDVVMPDMDGYEVCRQLKADENTRDIPVLFISMLDHVDEKVRAFASGGTDYITKPFQVEEVLARVHTHLMLRQLTRHIQEANAELSARNRRLEEQTAELADTNELLQTEVMERERIAQVLAYQKSLLEAITATSNRLLETNEWTSAVDAVLQELGITLRASHGYLFEVYGEEFHLRARIIARWSAANAEGSPLNSISISQQWADQMRHRRPVHGMPIQFAQDERRLLETHGIQSIVFVPVIVGADWWGFLAFDYCQSQRHWLRAEIDMLEIAADLLRAAIQRQRLEEGLRQHQRTLIALTEREAMSRELHDGLGQILGYIHVQAQAVEALMNNGQTEAALSNLRQVIQAAQHAQDDTRRFIAGLRDEISTEQDFYATIETMLHQFSQQMGITAHLSMPDVAVFPTFAYAVEEQILRILGEALANVRKHAAAHSVEVVFSFAQETAQVLITDDGVGFDPRGDLPDHFGLRMMRERAEQVGGKLEVRSERGRGTKLVLTVPYVQAQPDAEIDVKGIEDLRVLLVDDHPMFLEGLSTLLTARGVTVVGRAFDGLEAQEQARKLRPNVILMDVEMPRCNGLEAAQAISAELPDTKIVILTMSDDEDLLFEAIRRGAAGYLLKSLDARRFFDLLLRLLKGEMPIAPGLAAHMMAEFARTQRAGDESASPESDSVELSELSLRQWEILRMVAQDMTYKEIAQTLSLSEKTIKYHMRQILDRLQLENRRQAANYMRRIQ